MKRILIFALLSTCHLSWSQNNAFKNKEIENIHYFSKVWGFLKYYHPQVAAGKLDWDKEFIKKLPNVRNMDSKEDRATFYLDWIEGLGKIKECKKCNRNTKKEYSTKNFDLRWLDSDFFTPPLQEKLRNIEKNRFIKKPYYVTTNKVGGVVPQNEKTGENQQLPDENHRLLDLARYWNIIDYFFPYKYLTDQNWDDVLTEMIPKFINADSEQDYDWTRLELVTKLNDAHAFLSIHKTNNFGTKWIPSMFHIMPDSIPVISKHYNDSLAQLNGLEIGDKIIEADGVGVKEIIKSNSKYIPASNSASSFRMFQHAIVNGNSDSIHLKIERSGKTMNKRVGRYPSEMLSNPTTERDEPFKILDKGIGYIRLNMLEVSEKEVYDIAEKYTEECPKAIVFDLRAYPPYAIYLPGILGSSKKAFSKRLLPDISYPGKFYWEETSKTKGKKNEPYPGKVIILVDENTQSRGEYFAMLLQASDHSTTVGRMTAGADGTVSRYSFLGDRETRFTGVGIYYPDKGVTQRKGIRIDVEVEEDLESIQKGSDKILETALELVR